MSGKHSVERQRPARHRLIADEKPRSRVRPLFVAVAVAAAGLVVGVAGSAGTYAAWRSQATVKGGVVVTGNTNIQVGAATSPTLGPSYALSPSPIISSLGAGESTAIAVTVASTGTTPVNVVLSSVTPGSQGSNALFNALQLQVVPVGGTSACTGTITGGTSGSLTSFPATTNLFHLAAASGTNDPSQLVCLVFSLPSTAPTTTETLTAGFTLNFVGNQSLT